jgi:hypothetical protein
MVVGLLLGGMSIAAASEQAPAGQRRSLADLLQQPDRSAGGGLPGSPPVQVDDARVAAAGLRKLVGKRLTLYTDLPAAEAVDTLPEAFDQAFPQWCEYFEVDPAEHADWRMTGFLMNERSPFVRLGLLPRRLPEFPNGFQWGHVLWLYEKPSDYYRRHLLLHEGTHGFMSTLLGGYGSLWYKEGIAEMLATHRWHDGRLTLNYLPQDREEVPLWGRIKIVKGDVAARRGRRLQNVIEYSIGGRSDLEPYAWSWAATTLLQRHPRYRDRFWKLRANVQHPDFTERFRQLFRDDWGELCEEWQLFAAGLEYGHDVPSTAIDFTPGKPLPSSGAVATVLAKRGWQNSGLRLERGTAYRLRATGRYQVADQPQVWWCEPGGVSIRYYGGRPLGVLLAAVRPDNPQPGGASALLRPVVVGLGTTLTPEQTGTLYLKINDSAAELDDNAGELQVRVGWPD